MRIVYLDTGEEITAVIDKVKRVKEYSLALVVPKRSVLTQSIVNLKLLKRHVDSIGKNVIVVASDTSAYNMAKKVGLNVRSEIPSRDAFEDSGESADVSGDLSSKIHDYSRQEDEVQKMYVRDKLEPVIDDFAEDQSIQDGPDLVKTVPSSSIVERVRKESKQIRKNAQKNAQRRLQKNVFLPKLNVTLFFSFLLVSFLVAGLIFFVILPKASVVIQPETEQYISQFDVVVESSRDEFDIENKMLPGELVFFEEESETKRFATQTDKDVSEKARGQALITNTFSSSPQPLVAGTRFQLDDGRVYRLVSDAQVPGAAIEAGSTVAGRATVAIEAEDVGEEYNVSAGRSLSIPGLSEAKQADITAVIQSDIVGGSQGILRVLGDADIEAATNELTRELYNRSLRRIENTISDDQYFFEGALKKEVIERNISDDVDSEVSEFDLSIKTRVSTLLFSKSQVESVITENVADVLDGEKKLLEQGVDAGVRAELNNFDFEEEKMGMTVFVDKTVYYDIDTSFIAEQIKSKNREEIALELSKIEHIEGHDVSFWPFWVNKAPRIDKKIEIRLDIEK